MPKTAKRQKQPDLEKIHELNAKTKAEDGEEAGPDAGLEPRVVMDFRAPLLIGHERRIHALSGRGSLSTILETSSERK